MNKDYSEEIAEILQMANEIIDHWKEDFNEYKESMPQREVFDKKRSAFIRFMQTPESKNKFLSSKAFLTESTHSIVESLKKREKIASDGLIKYHDYIEDYEKELREVRIELIENSLDVLLYDDYLPKFANSDPEFIPPDKFEKECDAWLAELEKDLELKKNLEFKELERPAFMFVEDAISPLRESLAKINAYLWWYISFAWETKGCYIATAVYGSYDCPQVWTLRRYRDNELAKTWAGRTFIHIYYAISPTIVKWFGDTDWFKSIWRSKLDCMVKDLQERGFKDTPYNDRDW